MRRIHQPHLSLRHEPFVQKTLDASAGLDRQRGLLYADLVDISLSIAARKALKAMDPAKYKYQGEFARRYYGQGQVEKKRRRFSLGNSLSASARFRPRWFPVLSRQPSRSSIGGRSAS